MEEAVPTMDHDGDLNLSRSYITSCSERRLDDLVTEVAAVSAARLVDLYLLREADILDIEGRWSDRKKRLLPPTDEPRTATQIMAEDENVDLICRWVQERLRPEGRPQIAEIAALATYFPEISSRPETPQVRLHSGNPLSRYELAQRALVNAVRVAQRLTDQGLMRQAVVEIVCGSVFDKCECPDCQSRTIFRTPREQKAQLLCTSLEAVADAISRDGNGDDWAIGIELEPGVPYLINDEAALELFFNELDARNENGEPKYPLASKHVGLNLDIAHMKIAGVSCGFLNDYKDRIVHAHICDHPGMHTRDQSVGTWTPVTRYNGEDYPYLKLLSGIVRTDGQLLFTGTVALELEGCNRIGWIHNSLWAMRHLLITSQNNPDTVTCC